MRRFLVVLSLTLLSTTGNAQNVAGVGNIGCRELLSTINAPNVQVGTVHWVTGFLTGVNMARQSQGLPYRIMSINPDAIIGEIRAYCARNLDKPLIAAVEPMYRRFPEQR